MGRRAFSSAPKTMRAAVIHETGPASVVTCEAAWPVPDVADGEVLVKNQFIGLNFIDTYHRGGAPRCAARSRPSCCSRISEP